MTDPVVPPAPPPPPGAARGSGTATYSLLLFVNGASASSARAIRDVQELCDEHLEGRYVLTVINVRDDVELARERGVLATPTLMRDQPAPQRMRVGDFSDHAAVLATLELVSGGAPVGDMVITTTRTADA